MYTYCYFRVTIFDRLKEGRYALPQKTNNTTKPTTKVKHKTGYNSHTTEGRYLFGPKPIGILPKPTAPAADSEGHQGPIWPIAVERSPLYRNGLDPCDPVGTRKEMGGNLKTKVE